MRLPLEVVLMVGSQLDHSTLLSLSLTSKSLFKALQTSLELERDIRRRYRNIDILDDFREPLPYHRLLEQLVHDDRLASYVVSLECGEDIYLGGEKYCNLSVEEKRHRTEQVSRFRESCQALLLERLVQMAWISEQQRTRLLNRIFIVGDESAVLAVLICILVELRFLSPPTEWGNEVQELVQNITCDRRAPILNYTNDARVMTVSEPLSKLLIFRGNAGNGVHGLDLYEVLPWMDLPSLRRVILPCCRTNSFSEGATPPKFPWLSTPEIYLCDSSVTLSAITTFAKFLHRPCMIRQTLGFAGEYYEGVGLKWDHCEIKEYRAHDDGEGLSSTPKVNIETRYPASDLHEYNDDDELAQVCFAGLPESPSWNSMAEQGFGDLADWTKI